MRYGVLIPAYQPDEKLGTLVETLTETGLEVVVVNDGSSRGLDVFAALKELAGVTLLGYKKNMGKGHALKTGIEYMHEQGFEAVVTADADGQHRAEDIRKVAACLTENPGALICGMRDVSAMPAKSKAGNTLTRILFRALYGISMNDTQTGLRGIPLDKDSMPRLLELEGERYEYEMEMLIHSGSLFKDGIIEVPIETVYIEDNRSSHFRPLKDGARIYSLLFKNLPKFMLSSFSAFILDYALFNALYYLAFRSVAGPTLTARVISASFNYTINRRLVFKTKSDSFTAWNYFKLAGFILAANLILIKLTVDFLHMKAFLAKLIVECALYLVSFSVQQRLASKKN